MQLDRFTEKAQEAVVAAQQLATRLNHAQIDPEHLLAALVGQQGGIVPSVLRKMGVDPTSLARTLDADLQKRPKAYGGSEAGIGPRLRAVVEAAEKEGGAEYYLIEQEGSRLSSLETVRQCLANFRKIRPKV